MCLAYYSQILGAALVPIAKSVIGEDWILQQDNAAVRAMRHTNEFLEFYDVDTLAWPIKSLDLIVVENLLGCLAGGVYRYRSQIKLSQI